ncbi:VOC family protein [Pseudactinotalea terrae]|uniref:VOC family protein n=1 Tax=Pseudactinotalea terrae TaxID=1743262 RepID=UPI0012E23DB2|nr:VOC family protein [Pseudactinotalea terrae]
MNDSAVVELTIVLDATDPAGLADFWAAALRYRRAGAVGPFEVLLPPEGDSRPTLLLQRVAEAKQGKNRMHLDLHVADLDLEVDRLVALGAQRLGEETLGELRWVRMCDPEGNELDLVQG